jgi:hypothetical protein
LTKHLIEHNFYESKTGQSPEFIKPLENHTVFEGSMITLECIVKANPIPQIKWFHNKRLIRTSKNFSIEFQPESGLASLTIREIFVDDIGVFTCVAENRFGKSETKSNLEVKGEKNSQK